MSNDINENDTDCNYLCGQGDMHNACCSEV